jgi:hypothetical protein
MWPGDDPPPRITVEAFGCLVAPAVFKTDVAGYPGQAGSIPVRLRHTSAGPAALSNVNGKSHDPFVAEHPCPSR